MIWAQPTAIGSKARMARTRCPRSRGPPSSPPARPPRPARSRSSPHQSRNGPAGRRVERHAGARRSAAAGSWPDRSIRARSWTMICGWASPPMAPTRWRQRARPATVTSMGERVCGGRRRGPDLGRVALDEREADAPVVQEDAGGRLDQMRAEVQRVGLGQRDAEAVRVERAQVGGVAVADAGDGRRTACPAPAVTSGGAARAGRDAGRRRGQPGSGRAAPSPSAPSKSTSGRSCPTAAPDSTIRWAQAGSSGSAPSPAASATAAPARVR